jgi:prophage regulatory protein
MFLSVGQVAIRYGVTNDCIWRWVRADKFPKPIKLNGATRWKLIDIEKWESEK